MPIDGRTKFWREWIFFLLWCGIIAIESTELCSPSNTGHLLYAVLAIFGPLHLFSPVEWSRVSFINLGLRTTGHLVGYGILSWLSFRAWRASLAGKSFVSPSLRCASFAVLLSIAVASLDEWHQTFLPSRSGKISDVLLDTAAVLAVQIFILVKLKLRRHASLLAS